MRQAKVHVSIMGSEAQQKLCLHGLQSSAGYLQSKISDRIDTRYTPRLRFELDEGVKKSLAISQHAARIAAGYQSAAGERGDESDTSLESSNED